MKPLKLGLLTNGESIPAWAYTMVSRIEQEGFGKVVVVVCRKSDKKKGLWARVLGSRSKWFYFLYEFLDKKFFGVQHDAFSPKSLRTLLTEIPFLTMNPRKTKFSDHFEDKDIQKLEEFELDILIRLGFRILRGDILKVARFGIWSYHHGDNEVNRGGPPGFWEVFKNWPTTGVTLQILGEELDGGEVLDKLNTSTHRYSMIRNKNSLYWNGSSLLPRKIKDLSELGEQTFFDNVKKQKFPSDFYSNVIFKAPSNSYVLGVVFKVMYRLLSDKLNHRFNLDQWILMYSFSKKDSASLTGSFNKFRKIIPPKDRFWADPHVIHCSGKYYVFLEEFIYKTNLGHISVMELNRKGEYSTPKTIIEHDYHMSYPNVFEYQGDYYMIPETASNRTIDLYKCDEFPYKWTLVKSLFTNIAAWDTTFHMQDGICWLFMNIRENPGGSNRDELFVFSSDDLLNGQWHSHPENPVVSDVRSSRPAGRLFERKGDFIRPSQNSTGRYGRGMTMSRVKTLTTKCYEEEIVARVFPDWDKRMISTHSFSHAHDLTVTDGQLRRRRFL